MPTETSVTSRAPRISIVVPAHNAGEHLADCLDAIGGSDLPREMWELIVVDDASTDGTGDIAARFADMVLRTGDVARGPAFARNRGVTAAHGEIIVFVDADVAVHPDALTRLVGELDADQGLVAVFGSYDDDPLDPSLTSRYRNLLHHYAHQESAGRVATFWAGCGAARTAAFRAAGGFDENRYPSPQIEDIELGYRLSRVGQILLSPEIQGTHRKRWTVGAMMRTDFRDRAVPWVRFLLGTDSIPGAATPSLGRRAMLGTAAASGAAASVVLAMAGLGLKALAAGSVLLAASILFNLDFYRWLLRRGGIRLILVAIPLHLAYQLLSAVAVPVGAVLYLLRDRPLLPRTGESESRAVAGSRFIPLAFGEVGSRVVAFVATAYLARKLGASGFGQIAFAIAVVSHFGTALTTGIGEVGAREVARAPDRASRVASAGMTVRLLLAILAIVGIVALSSVLRIDPGTRTLTWLYALTVIPLALDTGWVYKGLGRTARVGASLLLDQVLSLALILLLVTSHSHVERVPLIQIAGDLAAAAFLAIPLFRGRWQRPDPGAVKAMAGRSGMITVSRILRTIVVSFDVVLLGLMVSSREVGWYSAAYRIVFFVMALIYASHVAFLPEVARLANDPRALSAVLSRTIGLALTVAIPFVVGGILIALPLMNLVFGSEYASGASSLQLLLVSLLFVGVHGATRNVFLATHRLGLETLIVATGVAVNIGLNFVLIPLLGIRGSAIATVAGEGVILAGVLIALMRMGIRLRLRESFPAVLAGGVLAGTILAFGTDRPPLQVIVVGAVAYVAAIGGITLVSRRRPAALVPEA